MRLVGAADYDFGSGRHHLSGVGSLLAGGAVADNLDLEAGCGGLLDDLANGQAEKRRNADAIGIGNGDGRRRR